MTTAKGFQRQPRRRIPDGPVGSRLQVQRKREFAADMGLSSPRAADGCRGAIAAYEQIVGEAWKPFERPLEILAHPLDRKAAQVQMAAG